MVPLCSSSFSMPSKSMLSYSLFIPEPEVPPS